MADFFDRLPLPRWVTPALGVCCRVPSHSPPRGTRHRATGGSRRGLGTALLSIPFWIVLIVPFARIVSHRSFHWFGGSGGISDQAW